MLDKTTGRPMPQQFISHTPARQAGVMAEQVRILYQQSLPGAIMQCVSILPINFLLEHAVQTAWRDFVVGGILFNGIATLICIWFYRRRRPAPQFAALWGNYLVFFNFVAGSLWGLMLYAAFGSQDILINFLIVFLSVTISVVAAPVLASYFAVYVAFCVPLTLIVAVRLLMERDAVFFTLGWFMPAALPLLLFYAFRMSKTWQESIQLRFENIDLITELTKQKNEAETAQKIAEEANLSKSKFLAAASHDLRQPLHALTLFAEALVHDEHDNKQKNIVDNIKSSVSAMEGLFNTLLDISKLDAGVVQPKLRDISMNEILQPLEKEYAELALQHGISFKCSHGAAIVYTDPVLLEAIIRNLVGNAFRYTQQGGVWVICQVLDDSSIAIEVGDTGIGIPEDQQKNIFNEFYQLNNPERDKTKGLGLGLAIVKRLVAILGYTLQVDSKPKRGSRFTLSVPKGEKNALTSQPLPEMDRLSFAIPELCVMVIDDDALVRESMDILLQGWGYTVVTVESEDEAVDAITLTDFSPDVLIADYQLRNHKTGVDAIERVFAVLQKKIPAILITGDIFPEHLQQAEKSGFPILHKPVMPVTIRTFLIRCQCKIA